MKRRHTLTHLTTHSKLLLSVPLALLVSLCLGIVCPSTTNAATFTVTNTNDTGAGSLRQAIDDANSNANPGTQDVIEFTIPGFGDQTIQPQSTLSITQSVLIDGYTQGDATENTDLSPNPLTGFLRVELDLSVSGTVEVLSSNVTLQGLTFNKGANYQVKALSADNLKIYGSYFNVDNTGLIRRADINQTATIYIENSDNVEIGGSQPERRNVISWCTGSCVQALGSGGQQTNNLKIQGNMIGVGPDAVSDQGLNGVGILLTQGVTNATIGGSLGGGEGNSIMHHSFSGIDAEDVAGLTIAGNRILANNASDNNSDRQAAITIGGSSNVTIGGTTSDKRNIIGGQNGSREYYAGSGILLLNSMSTNNPTHDVSIEHNYIGVIDDGNTPYENQGLGVVAIGDTYDVIVRSNIIRHSQNMSGVGVSDNAQSVAILQNSIYNNQSIGIDFNHNNTHDTADSSDSDTGPNELLNSPGYTNITENAGNTDVTFTLDVPAGEYRIEFFSNTVADPSGIGEGETYLGYTTITHTGSGLEQFSHTLTGTGHTNLALTATKIDPSTPSGFGPTSEFGGNGQTIASDPADVAIKKELLNPEDFANGNILNYRFTYINNGPGEVDISTLNSTTPGGDVLFLDILPPQLTYLSVTGDVACTYLGDGSAAFFGPILASHSTYGVAGCGYSGPNPRILQAGESISFTLHAEVIDDSNPTFTNYAFANPSTFDNDNLYVNYVISNNQDIIDSLINRPTNNLAAASSTPTDIETTKTLDNPEEITVGGTAEYTLTFTNNGPSAINPQQFNLSGPNPFEAALFLDFLPPNLTYISSSNPDVVCSDAGTLASLNAGTAFTDYPDHHIVVCGYFGPITSLTTGQSISTTLSAAVNSVPTSFTNFSGSFGSIHDPDYLLFQSIGYRGEQVITSSMNQGINNLSSATYTTSYDHDGDGVADQVEDNTAPGGDGNGDGTADKLQSDVTSTPNSVTGAYTTLAVTGDCNTVTNFAVAPESSQSILDTQYNYPLGLKDFSLDCTTPGGSANATIYYDKVYSADSYQVRKLMDSTYSDLVDATIGTATVNGNQVTTITYSLTDGGAIDADKATNSSITDPVGPGVLASTGSSIGDGIGNLVNTGVGVLWMVVAVLALTIIATLTAVRRKQIK